VIIEICWVTNTKFEEKCIVSILVVINWEDENISRTFRNNKDGSRLFGEDLASLVSSRKDFFLQYLVNPILNRSNIRVVIHSPSASEDSVSKQRWCPVVLEESERDNRVLKRDDGIVMERAW
jgi:hypothetical protein